MPNWIPITIETLYEAKVAALIDACDSAALASGQPNRSAGIIQGVVEEVRNSVSKCPNNQVDADLTTIPKGLRNLAVTLIIAALKNTIEQPLTEDEARDVKYRRDQLAQIEICKGPSIDQPDTPVAPEVQQSGAATIISKNPRPLSSGNLQL
jgi:hypothetical protein